MSPAPAEQAGVSPESYLAGERASQGKHELWRGEVFAMAGASYVHNRIVCGPPAFYDATQDVLTNPAAVFEVLSESTERFDRGEKFVGYRSIPSLRECVLVSQHERRIEHYVRQPGGTWVLHEHEDEGAVTLACGGTLDLAVLYRDTGA